MFLLFKRLVQLAALFQVFVIGHTYRFGVHASTDLIQMCTVMWLPLVVFAAIMQFVQLYHACFPPPSKNRIQSLKESR